MDNSWDYNEGEGERRMGQALREGYRDKVFLMTKIDGRTKKEATRQLEESLRRLQVDCIDLVQHHEIIRFDDAHRVFDPEGANAALLAAREAGKLRFIGFTFDTVQMPINVMDAHYRNFAQWVVPELVRDGLGVLGMKSLGNDIILKSKTVTAMECLHYALNEPTPVVITGIDSMKILDQTCEAARTFQPMSAAARATLLAKTKDAAARGEYELFKTRSLFDSTAKNPKRLGEEPDRIADLMPA